MDSIRAVERIERNGPTKKEQKVERNEWQLSLVEATKV